MVHWWSIIGGETVFFPETQEDAHLKKYKSNISTWANPNLKPTESAILCKPVPNSGVQKQLAESKFQAGWWVEVGRNGLNFGKSKESILCPIYA